MTLENEKVLCNFLIDIKLIEPIDEILKNLKAKAYRDIDDKWLEEKLYSFIHFAADALGVSVTNPKALIVMRDNTQKSIMSSNKYEHYTNYFTLLRDYFLTLKVE